MTSSLIERTNQEAVPLVLPKRKFSLLSHLANIDYCIEQIRSMHNDRKDIVVGYTLARSIGTIEVNYILINKERADELKRRDRNLRYFTLDDLLREKKAYQEGKYKVDEEGYFVGIK